MFWLFCVFALALGSTADGDDEGGCKAEQSEKWSYGGKNGPKNWYKIPGYEACAGSFQSPIDIISEDTSFDENLGPLDLKGYDQPIKSAEVLNDGHTVLVTPKDGVKRIFRNSGVPGEVSFRQLHFHWGNCSDRGSEHTIDGMKYPMEMHLVHQNSEGGIAVIGVFLKEAWSPNKNLEPITKVLQRIRYKDDSTTLASQLNLTSLLPKSRDSYFRYVGSLTIPACTEGVQWTVIKDPIPIGRSQLRLFRTLKSTKQSNSEQCPLVNNFRPLQNLNNRPIHSSTPNTA